MDRVPGLIEFELGVRVPDLIFGDFEDLGQVFVGETVFLRLEDEVVCRDRALGLEEFLFFLDEFLHLLDEVLLDLGQFVDLVDGSTFAEGFIHDEVALGGGGDELLQKFIFGEFVEIGNETETVAALLEGTDGLLECFLISFANAHDFADGSHLSAELVFDALELLKGPAGKLDDDVIAVRDVLVEGTVLAVRQFGQGEAGGQLRGDQSDRETGGLGSKGGGAGGTGVDLDDDDAVGDRVVSELDVRAADDADVLDDLVGLFLETVHDVLRDGQHGSRAEGVAGVDTHGVDILDEADRDHVVVLVTDDFELELFPAGDTFLNEDLVDEGGLKATGTDDFQFFPVVDEAAAFTAHGVSGTQDDGVTQTVCDLEGFFHRIGDLGAGHLDAERLHGLLELDTVFTALDGIDLDADDFDAVLVEDAFLVKLGGKVQTGLTAEVRQQGVRALLVDDLLEAIDVERLDVGDVGHFGVCHDGRGVRVDENDLVTEASQRLTRLSAGVVELAGLSDDDGTGPDDEYFMDVCSLRHKEPSSSSIYFFCNTIP